MYDITQFERSHDLFRKALSNEIGLQLESGFELKMWFATGSLLGAQVRGQIRTAVMSALELE